MNFGRYTQLNDVGKTELGQLYRGIDPLLDRSVLLVDIHSRIIEGKDFRTSFLKQAQTWVTVGAHPNLVELQDLLQENGGVQLGLSEFSPGTLENYLLSRVEPLGVSEACQIIRETCAALIHIHEHDILHQRVSTDTITIGSDNSVAVFGIGVAKLAWRGKTFEELTKQFRFYSPEQTRGGVASVETEIYSVGAILYRMLTGQFPFPSECMKSLVERHLHDTPIPPIELTQSIPKNLSDAILKCLAKDPTDRFHSVEELLLTLPRP